MHGGYENSKFKLSSTVVYIMIKVLSCIIFAYINPVAELTYSNIGVNIIFAALVILVSVCPIMLTLITFK